MSAACFRSDRTREEPAPKNRWKLPSKFAVPDGPAKKSSETACQRANLVLKICQKLPFLKSCARRANQKIDGSSPRFQ